MCRAPGQELERELNGCDADASESVFEITCSRCNDTDLECEVCNGTGNEKIYRCPMAIADREIMDEIVPALMLADSGIWPVSGGSTEQSRSFIWAFFEYRKAKAEYEERKHKEAIANAKRR